MQFRSISPIDRTLPGVNTPAQSRPGTDEGAHCIPQSSNISGDSPSDSLESYPGHSLQGWSYPLAEMLSVYTTAPADRVIGLFICIKIDLVLNNHQWLSVIKPNQTKQKMLFNHPN